MVDNERSKRKRESFSLAREKQSPSDDRSESSHDSGFTCDAVKGDSFNSASAPEPDAADAANHEGSLGHDTDLLGLANTPQTSVNVVAAYAQASANASIQHGNGAVARPGGESPGTEDFAIPTPDCSSRRGRPPPRKRTKAKSDSSEENTTPLCRLVVDGNQKTTGDRVNFNNGNQSNSN